MVATPLSGVPVDDVVATESRVTEDGTVKVGGKPVGHLQPDGVTVVDGEGNVVGVRNADGSIMSPPTSAPVPGTEVVPQSTVDGDVVTGPDGQTIGTLQPDGKTVVDSEGGVVGVRSADGAVVATPLSGVPVDDVVATESRVSADGTVKVGGKPIGRLQPDGVTVVDGVGNVVGVRNADGSIMSPDAAAAAQSAAPSAPPPPPRPLRRAERPASRAPRRCRSRRARRRCRHGARRATIGTPAARWRARWPPSTPTPSGVRSSWRAAATPLSGLPVRLRVHHRLESDCSRHGEGAAASPWAIAPDGVTVVDGEGRGCA